MSFQQNYKLILNGWFIEKSQMKEALQDCFIQIFISEILNSTFSEINNRLINCKVNMFLWCRYHINQIERAYEKQNNILKNLGFLQTIINFSQRSIIQCIVHKNSEFYYAAKCIDKSYGNETEN
ncbi:unnamed protein product [Paramecium sonneborni]|uniref:Uncharacterized protein n=1 Tax=Paramecium sonneborni TaxID=65129 RepID=A0A8S1RNS5_9CILI|nr:unnamed protein product [Paramecium sonneborni]